MNKFGLPANVSTQYTESHVADSVKETTSEQLRDSDTFFYNLSKKSKKSKCMTAAICD